MVGPRIAACAHVNRCGSSLERRALKNTQNHPGSFKWPVLWPVLAWLIAANPQNHIDFIWPVSMFAGLVDVAQNIIVAL